MRKKQEKLPTKRFSGIRLASAADVEIMKDLDAKFCELCDKIKDPDVSQSEKNNLRIKRLAIGQRLVRVILTHNKDQQYYEKSGCDTLKLLRDGVKINGVRIAGYELQGHIVDGEVGRPSQTMLYMLTIADRAGFDFYSFYSNVLDAINGDEIPVFRP